jgi:hypothetical protein
LDRVVEVVRRISSRTNDPEGVAVKVEWMRGASGATRNGYFDDLVALESVNTAGGQEARRRSVTAEDLKENGDRRRLVPDAIDCESFASLKAQILLGGLQGIWSWLLTKPIVIVNVTSASPAPATPGTGEATSGCRLVSTRGFERAEVDVGSASDAPE